MAAGWRVVVGDEWRADIKVAVVDEWRADIKVAIVPEWRADKKVAIVDEWRADIKVKNPRAKAGCDQYGKRSHKRQTRQGPLRSVTTEVKSPTT